MNEAVRVKERILNSFKEEDFFEALIGYLCEENLLTRSEIRRIQIELAQLLKEYIQMFNGGKSSSILSEQAEELMHSIYYTLGLYFKGLYTIYEILEVLKEYDIRTIFNRGFQIIEDNMRLAECELKEVMLTRLEVSNYAYNDSVDRALPPLFMGGYDKKFGAHFKLSTIIDYPLCLDKRELLGVEYIVDYIHKLHLENILCGYFDIKKIQALLDAYSENTDELLINIYELVISNALANIMLGKGKGELQIYINEALKLQQQLEVLSDEELKEVFMHSASCLVSDMGINEGELSRYIYESVDKMMVIFKQRLKLGRIEQAVVVEKHEEKKSIQYVGGERLDDDKFRKLTEKIRSCNQIFDKIALIHANMNHVEDLIDLLQADCLFDDEYVIFYQTLKDAELSILIKELLNVQGEIEEEYLNQCGKDEWKKNLIQYFRALDEEKQRKIIKFAKQIKRF